MVQYVFFHLKIQKQQFVSLILVEKNGIPMLPRPFFTMKTSEEGGSHFRIPAFFGKFMDRVGRARAPISA